MKSNKDLWVNFRRPQLFPSEPKIDGFSVAVYDEQIAEVLNRFIRPMNVNLVVEYGCFIPQTPILTADFEEEEILDVKKGEIIISAQGVERPVLNHFTRQYRGDIISFDVCGLKEVITSTLEHPFLAIKRKEIICNKHCSGVRGGPTPTICIEKHRKGICELYNCVPISPLLKMRYIDAINLEIGDYLAIPSSYNNGGEEEYTDDLLDLCGYYLAEGNILYCRGIEHGVNFTFGTKETNLVEDVVRLSKSLFDYDPKVKYRNEKGSIEVMIFKKEVGLLIKNLCGERSHKKRILSMLMMTLPPSKLLRIFRTFAKGDGHYRDDVYDERRCKNLTVKTVSVRLGNQLWWILVKNKIIASIKGYFNGFSECTSIIVPRNQLWKIYDSYMVDGNSSRRFGLGNYIFTPIVDIQKEYYEGKVHNLKVGYDESYVAGKVGVHNCGDGCWIEHLAEKYPLKRFVGYEWNPTLVKISKERCAKLGNASFVEADISQKWGGCDLFFSLGVLEHFESHVQVLSNWVSGLGRGGYAVTCVPSLTSRKWCLQRCGMKEEDLLKDRVILKLYGYEEVWSPRYFLSVLEKAGLKVIEHWTIDRWHEHEQVAVCMKI